jgi:hypothetical protein
MELKRIKIAGFRGFNDEQVVELDGDLIIVSGDNHTGKTSLAEALEWLFFGYTVRCRRGKDQYSKTEYRDTYRNIHYPDDRRVYVELEALHQDDVITLRRELIDAEASQAYLDGQLVGDFTSLGFSPTASHPIIAQHGLRDFIYTNPNTRREILSYVLGLDPLIRLQKDIQDAHTGYKQRKPKDCLTYDRLSGEAEQYGVLGSVLSHLETGSLQEAQDTLLEEIRERTDSPELPESAIPERLSETRAKKEANVLNLSAYQISDDLEAKSKTLRKKIERLNQNFLPVIGRLTEFIRASSDSSEAKQIRFLKLGLELISDLHPEICPFCKRETLTEEQREAYAKLVEEFEDPKQISKQIDEELKELASEWQGIFEEASIFALNLPEGEKKDRIRQLLADKAELTEYETARIEMAGQREGWNDLHKEGEEQIECARQMLEKQQYDETFFEQLGKLPSRLKKLALSLFECQVAYKEQFHRIKPILEAKISSTEEVRAIALLQDFWNKWPEIARAVRYNCLESKFSELQVKVRSFIAQKQEERLEQKERDIREWYESLNPNEDVTFSRIRVTKTALRLLGESYGKEIEAPPNFSQSQINCLGLAVYLIQATSVGDLGFVILDDPVQSMDESHSERLKMDVVDRLMKTGHQVILLTHLDKFAENLALVHRRRFPYRIEFTGYSQVGPSIEEKPPQLKDYLNQANEYRAGNAERRCQASGCLRRAVERIIKILYQQATGSLPAEYRDVSFPRLKRDLLPKCDQLSPQEADGIRATYDFVVSYPHDDMTVEPPASEQLQPHISRLEQLCKKHNLIQ